MMKVFIDGSLGTTGLNIRERLSVRQDIVLLDIPLEKRKDLGARKEIMNSADIVFLCLPDDAAKEAVRLITNPSVKVIDASTAHRCDENFAYGFPELDEDLKEKIINAKMVANPGCHASGFIAIVYPLIKKGIISNDYPLTCFSLTGYTGGGKKMIEQYENSPTKDLFSPRIYGLGQMHKHLKEMKYICNLKREPIFCPIVSNFPRGMVTQINLFSDLMNIKMTKEELKNFYSKYYESSKLINVTEVETMISSNDLEGFDNMEIIISGNDERLCVSARFDNLGKGASGSAIECMNLLMGVDPLTSLKVKEYEGN